MIYKNLVTLKCWCNEKIVDPILNATEQHFQMSLNGVFSFSQCRFVFEIFRFIKYANWMSLDVIYSRIINYIYKIMNIFGCRGRGRSIIGGAHIHIFVLCIIIFF